MGETNKKDFELTKEVEIDGVKYKFQRLPVRAAMELRQGWQDENGNAIATKMHDAILEHIVIEPKGLTIDDFNLPAEVEKSYRAGFGIPIWGKVNRSYIRKRMLEMYDLFWYPILEGYISLTEAERMYEDQLIELQLAIEHHKK